MPVNANKAVPLSSSSTSCSADPPGAIQHFGRGFRETAGGAQEAGHLIGEGGVDVEGGSTLLQQSLRWLRIAFKRRRGCSLGIRRGACADAKVFRN